MSTEVIIGFNFDYRSITHLTCEENGEEEANAQ